MIKELDHLALDAAERPLAAIVGGAKVSTKLPVIQSLLEKWLVISPSSLTVIRSI